MGTISVGNLCKNGIPQNEWFSCLVEAGMKVQTQSKISKCHVAYFKHFQSTIFFLIAFFSQHLNYFVIVIWIVLNYIGNKNNPIVVNLLKINIK